MRSYCGINPLTTKCRWITLDDNCPNSELHTDWSAVILSRLTDIVLETAPSLVA